MRRSADSGTRRPLEESAADPCSADHVRVGSENQAAGQVLGFAMLATGDWCGQLWIHRNQVSFLAHLDGADGVLKLERPCSLEAAEPQPLERPQSGAGPAEHGAHAALRGPAA